MKNLLSRTIAGCLFTLAVGAGGSLIAQTSAFTGADLGTPTYAGSATANGDGTTTVKGGGADIWNNADQGFYYYTSVTGKVWDARMRIISFDGPDTWSKVELMARRPDPLLGTPSAGDPQLDITSTRTAGINRIDFAYRGTRDGGSGSQVAGGLTPNYPNEWLRITRFNTVFRMYFSKDGTTWTFFNSQDTATTANGFDGTPWEDPTLIGVAVTAHNDGTTNLGVTVISNLTVNVTPVTAPTVAGVLTPISGTTNVYAYTEASFNFVATNNATPAGVYGMNYAWYKNNALVSTNPMGPNYTFLTTPSDDGAQIYCIASVADTNYSSITVTSGVTTLTTKSGALVYTNGLKREFFTNATRQQVEMGSVVHAATVSLASKADIGNDGANYTERLSGYFIPPADGAYVFFINSDDDSDLYLSADDTAANKQLIAQEKDWSNPYQWLAVGGTGNNNTPANKRSDQFTPDGGITYPYANGISLTGGQRYYLEAVHHQGGGGGNLAVTYQTTNQIADPNWALNFTNGVLPLLDATNHNIAAITWAGTNLQWVAQPPASVNAFEGQSASFSAMAVSDAEMVPSYQWYISTNGTLPGAAYAGATSTNLTLGTIPANYDGAKFYAIARTYEGGLSITSSVVTLTVQQAVFEAGFVKDERWSGQTSVGNLEAGALGAPDYTMVVPEWGVNVDNPNVENNIARRVSGYFIPPTTGNYVFFVTSDDESDLFLSTDNTPANKRMVCQQGCVEQRSELALAYGQQRRQHLPDALRFMDSNRGGSAPYASGIALTAGTKYYMEQDYHQGGARRNLAATFKLVGDPDPAAGNETRLKGERYRDERRPFHQCDVHGRAADATAPPMGYATFSADGTTDSHDSHR